MNVFFSPLFAINPIARLATELWLGSAMAIALAPYAMAAEAQRRFWGAIP